MKIKDLLEGSGELGDGPSYNTSDFYRHVKDFVQEYIAKKKPMHLGTDDKMHFYMFKGEFDDGVIGIDKSININDKDFKWESLYKHPTRKKFLSDKPADVNSSLENNLLKVYFTGKLSLANKKISKHLGEKTKIFHFPVTNPAFARQGIATRAYSIVLDNFALMSDSDQSKEMRWMWLKMATTNAIAGVKCYSFTYDYGFLNRLIKLDLEDVTGNTERYKELLQSKKHAFILTKKVK